MVNALMPEVSKTTRLWGLRCRAGLPLKVILDVEVLKIHDLMATRSLSSMSSICVAEPSAAGLRLRRGLEFGNEILDVTRRIYRRISSDGAGAATVRLRSSPRIQLPLDWAPAIRPRFRNTLFYHLAHPSASIGGI